MHLLLLLGISVTSDEVVSVSAVVIPLVLDGELGKVTKDVLHVGIGSAALGTSEVVQPCDLVHQVVHNSNDNNDGNGVEPDNDDGDNGGVAILGEKDVLGDWVRWLTEVATEPSEDTEEG